MKKLLVHASLMISVLMMTFTGCKKPDEGLKIVFEGPAYTNQVSVQVFDAATGKQMGLDDENFEIEIDITGPDAGKVVNNQGGDEIKSYGGFISVALNSSTVPSPQSPIKFNIILKKSGYLTTSVAVTVVDEGAQALQAFMVDLSNPPTGVASLSSNAVVADGSGVTTSQIVLETAEPVTDAEKTKAKVTIPAGVTLMDANMNPVSGTITTELTYFNNQDEESMRAFPGGFAAELQNETVLFKTAGFIAMEMRSSNGTEIKNFSSPISMTVEVPSNTTDFAGTTVFDGMKVPIWSYEPSTGVWTEEVEATIVFNSSTQKYECTFDMIHLSDWNLDFKGTTCTIPKKLIIKSNATTDTYRNVAIYSGGSLIRTDKRNLKNGTEYNLVSFPADNTSTEMRIYKKGKNIQNSTTSDYTVVNFAPGCGGDANVDLDLTIDFELEIDITANCSSGNRSVKPTMPIYARKANTDDNWEYVGQMVKGKLYSDHFTKGQPYEIATLFFTLYIKSDRTFTATESAHSTTMTVDNLICNLLETGF